VRPLARRKSVLLYAQGVRCKAAGRSHDRPNPGRHHRAVAVVGGELEDGVDLDDLDAGGQVQALAADPADGLGDHERGDQDET
jgi:hypothetical protein